MIIDIRTVNKMSLFVFSICNINTYMRINNSYPQPLQLHDKRRITPDNPAPKQRNGRGGAIYKQNKPNMQI
jgi:hypothetical protein